jgi:hypothetical protein
MALPIEVDPTPAQEGMKEIASPKDLMLIPDWFWSWACHPDSTSDFFLIFPENSLRLVVLAFLFLQV